MPQKVRSTAHAWLGHAILLLSTLALLSACISPAPAPTPLPTPIPTPTAGPILARLGNIVYPLDASNNGSVALQNGLYEELLLNSQTWLRVQLEDLIASGDLNGDGTEDAAVLLTVEPGDGRKLTYLAVVFNLSGEPQPFGSLSLGDHLLVKDVQIEIGFVTVTYLTRLPGEAADVEPTLMILHKYGISQGFLQLIESTE